MGILFITASKSPFYCLFFYTGNPITEKMVFNIETVSLVPHLPDTYQPYVYGPCQTSPSPEGTRATEDGTADCHPAHYDRTTCTRRAGMYSVCELLGWSHSGHSPRRAMARDDVCHDGREHGRKVGNSQPEKKKSWFISLTNWGPTAVTVNWMCKFSNIF